MRDHSVKGCVSQQVAFSRQQSCADEGHVAGYDGHQFVVRCAKGSEQPTQGAAAGHQVTEQREAKEEVTLRAVGGHQHLISQRRHTVKHTLD
jgi:hypothetical protein